MTSFPGHSQTEKQRIIWAYKILFLDVLFPLNLKKVVPLDTSASLQLPCLRQVRLGM